MISSYLLECAGGDARRVHKLTDVSLGTLEVVDAEGDFLL
jgi:hypothetical protein